MRRLLTFHLLPALVLLAGAPVAAQESLGTPLERARQTFAVADEDADGVLDAQELAKASIGAAEYRAWDVDQSGGLSGDEFLGYYRQLVIDAGKAPGAGLDLEVRRVAKARGEEADRKRKSIGSESASSDVAPSQSAPKGQAPGRTTADKYRRARAALDERLTRAGGRTLTDVGKAQVDTRREVVMDGRLTISSAPATGARTIRPSLTIRESLERVVKNRLEVTDAGPRSGSDAPIPDPVVASARSDELEKLTAVERDRLQRSFDVLEARARSAGWTDEQLAGQKRLLVTRLRDSAEESSKLRERPAGKVEQKSVRKASPTGDRKRGARPPSARGLTVRRRHGNRGSGPGFGGAGPRF
jgi:hypothetical protein